MCEILSVLLLYQPLQVWQAALNGSVPEVLLAPEEPLSVIRPDLILKSLVIWQVHLSHDEALQRIVESQAS